MKNYRLCGTILVMICSLIMSASCSRKLPPETLPSATTSSIIEEVFSEITEPEETSISETTLSHGPYSTAVVTDHPVDVHGSLSVSGLGVVDQNLEPVTLRGVAVDLASDDIGFINQETIRTVTEDWGCNVVRVIMKVGDDTYGYLSDPDGYFNSICSTIDMCTEQGVYVIVDLDLPDQCDYTAVQETAVDLFTRISAIYPDNNAIIYEICSNVGAYNSEDPDNSVSWSNNVRPYAEAVIGAIRGNNADNLIITGTPVYQSETALASISLIEDADLLYSFSDLGSIPSSQAIGIPLIYTSMNGIIVTDLQVLEEAGIGWCYCGIGPDGSFDNNLLNFSSDILTDDEKLAGHWPDEFLTADGIALRDMLTGIASPVDEITGDTDVTEETSASQEATESSAEDTAQG